ncbi:hypothetical protein J6590_082474 [Homalodisca vitripennis]|nr:hypothetical protein J6590_082474 [Homalodisca vitripennis]
MMYRKKHEYYFPRTLHGRAIVVGCLNKETKEWLEKHVHEHSPFEGIKLKMDPAVSLIKIFRISTFIRKYIEVDNKQDLSEVVKDQNNLKITNGLLMGGKLAPTANSWSFKLTKNP